MSQGTSGLRGKTSGGGGVVSAATQALIAAAEGREAQVSATFPSTHLFHLLAATHRLLTPQPFPSGCRLAQGAGGGLRDGPALSPHAAGPEEQQRPGL